MFSSCKHMYTPGKQMTWFSKKKNIRCADAPIQRLSHSDHESVDKSLIKCVKMSPVSLLRHINTLTNTCCIISTPRVTNCHTLQVISCHDKTTCEWAGVLVVRGRDAVYSQTWKVRGDWTWHWILWRWMLSMTSGTAGSTTPGSTSFSVEAGLVTTNWTFW